AFVVKLAQANGARIFSTLLGGAAADQANGVAVDIAANIYAVGQTSSTNFPTAGQALRTSGQGDVDGFVTKLSPIGQLVYSTYFGGVNASDVVNAVWVDRSKNKVYITGQTDGASTFPLVGSFNPPLRGGGGADAFVAKLNLDGTLPILATSVKF